MALSNEQIESLRIIYENEASALFGYDSFEEYCHAQYEISLSYALNLMRNGQYVKAQITPALRWAIWERDDFRCYYCGCRQFLSVDHILPESKGGTLDPENLLTACMPCNRAKGVKSFDEFTSPEPEAFSMEWMIDMFLSMRLPVNYSTGARELVVVPFDDIERGEESSDQF